MWLSPLLTSSNSRLIVAYCSTGKRIAVFSAKEEGPIICQRRLILGYSHLYFILRDRTGCNWRTGDPHCPGHNLSVASALLHLLQTMESESISDTCVRLR